MNKIKGFRLIILAIACLFTLTNGIVAQKSSQIGATPTSFIVLNEIITDNPGAENNACNYVELRGDPSSAVGSDTYLVEFEGDESVTASNPGVADFVRNISDEAFGANGILTIRGTGTCGSRSYTGGGGTEITDSGASLEGGTITFMLINAPPIPGFIGGTAIMEGTDYDTNDDGMLDALPMNATIIDAVGWTDQGIVATLGGGGSDFVYGGVDITPGTGTPMGATRNDANTTPNSATAWFAGDIVGDGVDGVTYNQPAGLRSRLLGPGFMIAFLTPGARNLAPTAAPGTISGRVRTGKGHGIKHAVIMITGGNLTQPIYATSNQFGYYKFEDLTVGQSYTMQVMSGRYTFDNASRIVNLGDSLTNEDFVTTTSIRIESGNRRSDSPKNRILKKQ